MKQLASILAIVISVGALTSISLAQNIELKVSQYDGSGRDSREDLNDDKNRGRVEDEERATSSFNFSIFEDNNNRNFGGVIWNRLLILLQLKDTAGTTSPDNLAKEASELTLERIKHNSATLKWKHNDFSKVEVYLSTSSPVILSSNSSQLASSNKFGFPKKIKLKNLEENTTYYYRIVVTDHLGNSTTSKELSFTTKNK